MKNKVTCSILCIILWICFPIISFCQPIQTGSWSTPSGDVTFYVSQQSQLDTLRVKLTFSGSCSGSMTQSSYGISITNRTFTKDLGSIFDGSTGSIEGTFSVDGASCNGTYSYNDAPCDPINVTWSATLANAVVDTSEIDAVNIVDANLKVALIDQGVDTDADGVISQSEAEAVTTLDVSGLEISDMTGIEAFIYLETLDCGNNQITSLDVSSNLVLATLWCNSNQLTSLDVSNNTLLDDLWCSNNQITTLDISKNTALTQLWCSMNELSNLDVSKNSALTILQCRNNQITSLDVSNNTLITDLVCLGNQLSALDISNNPALELLWCGDNQLTVLDVSNNPALYDLWCSNNQLSSLDVSYNPSLEELWCDENLLSNLDVSNNPALTVLSCSMNPLNTLDISSNTALTLLFCFDNQLSTLDVTNNVALESLMCDINQLTSLDVTNNLSLVDLWCGNNLISCLDISKNTALGSESSEFSEIELSNMPTLTEVCVWTMPFPPSGVIVDTSSSPNVIFTTECSNSCGTDIEELSQSWLKIYPNPVIDILTLETDHMGQLSVEISSLNGQKAYSAFMEGNSHQIDLSSYRKGIYFITVKSKDFITTKKIVKL